VITDCAIWAWLSSRRSKQESHFRDILRQLHAFKRVFKAVLKLTRESVKLAMGSVLLSLLGRRKHYLIEGRDGDEVVGKDKNVVQASPPDAAFLRSELSANPM
jgi:hypothetical protein